MGTVKNQKMTKKNQTVRNQTVKNQKTTRKAKNQKVQHQSEKMVNGKNVKNSWALWEVLLNVLLIHVFSHAMMVPKLLTDLQKPNVSKTRTKLSHGARTSVTVA